MSFSITLFGPRHYFWWAFRDGEEAGGHKVRRAWFYRPDRHSAGGVGFCVPGLHASFQWGRSALDEKGRDR